VVAPQQDRHVRGALRRGVGVVTNLMSHPDCSFRELAAIQHATTTRADADTSMLAWAILALFVVAVTLMMTGGAS
jgi:hypothetical protein